MAKRPVHTPINRRMSKRGLATTFGCLALLLALNLNWAAAGISWCRADPHVQIGHKSANIFVERGANGANSNNAPIQLAVIVPLGIGTAVLAQDSGFGHGYDVSFEASSEVRVTGNVTRAQVRAYVPPSDVMPIRLSLDSPAIPSGTTP